MTISYISRDLEKVLPRLAASFRVLAVLGPRQSGKTTLVRKMFPTYAYVSCENSEIAQVIQDDPQGFLQFYSSGNGLIIDEFQKSPQLLSALQTWVDNNPKPGFFVLTGSQNYLMNAAISQSLAGRVGVVTLLPLSLHELSETKSDLPSLETVLAQGLYPDIVGAPQDYAIKLASYLATYVERDVRDLKQVGDLLQFRLFIKMCAARVGQLINYTSLANDCGISLKTAKAWLSVLEAAYIVFFVQPHHQNFSKRLVKTPKLYFYDTGLVCSLLDISPQALLVHPLRGALFESLIMSELIKTRFNTLNKPNLYFWRDKTGHEVDCIFEPSFGQLVPIEIKSGKTLTTNFAAGLEFYSNLAGQHVQQQWVVYGGNEPGPLKMCRVLPWYRAWEIVSQDND